MASDETHLAADLTCMSCNCPSRGQTAPSAASSAWGTFPSPRYPLRLPELLGVPSRICPFQPAHLPHDTSPHFYWHQGRKNESRLLPRGQNLSREFLVENSTLISTSASKIAQFAALPGSQEMTLEKKKLFPLGDLAQNESDYLWNGWINEWTNKRILACLPRKHSPHSINTSPDHKTERLARRFSSLKN